MKVYVLPWLVQIHMTARFSFRLPTFSGRVPKGREYHAGSGSRVQGSLPVSRIVPTNVSLLDVVKGLMAIVSILLRRHFHVPMRLALHVLVQGL